MACHLQVDADADAGPVYHFDVDPDPAYHVDADPDLTFPFDADPDLHGSPPLQQNITEDY